MRKQTFYNWLTEEVFSSRMALMKLYENRDHLLYVEAPPLRKKYMEIFGDTEEKVLQAELEVSLLRRKIELIQSAVNRREPIDAGALDARLEEEKQKRLSEIESSDLTLQELPQLTEEQQQAMQRRYREITNRFHPALNPHITGTQRELYEKAVEAYKMQDEEAIKLIHDMLLSPGEHVTLRPSRDGSEPDPKTERSDYRMIAEELSTDYLLAKTLYGCFSPLEEDAVMLDTLRSYDTQRESLEEEIAAIRAGFPFNAVSTMNDSQKTDDYFAELQFRARQCETEKAALEKKVAELMEGHTID